MAHLKNETIYFKMTISLYSSISTHLRYLTLIAWPMKDIEKRVTSKNTETITQT